MKKTVLFAAAILTAIVLSTGIVYAAAWNDYSIDDGDDGMGNENTDVRFWGNQQMIVIDANDLTDSEGSSNLHNEVFLYIDPLLGGVASSPPNDPGGRAAVLVTRAGTGPNDDDAEAYMESSGGAEVRVESDGDVLVTLGS